MEKGGNIRAKESGDLNCLIKQPFQLSGMGAGEMQASHWENIYRKVLFCPRDSGGSRDRLQVMGKYGRDGRIRTGGPLLPKQMRYQAAPRPDGKDMGLKYKRKAANRQRPRNRGVSSNRPDRYESSSPAVFISAISARRA